MKLPPCEDLEVIGKIEQIETIAVGNRIHEIARLRKAFGAGRWRKIKGIATVRLSNCRRKSPKFCQPEVPYATVVKDN